jgi:very-short-patch-repair endonuclease/Mor family transcriptional regulator
VARIAGQASLNADERAQIAARYAAGETVRTLRTEYHRTRQTIKDIILDAGYEIRPPGYGKGRKWTPEWRAAHHAATQTPEFAEKSRRALQQRLPRMRGPAVNTFIEQRLHDALRKAGIGFTTQAFLLERYLVDMELRQARVIIEADGEQHMLPDQKLADAERDAALTATGYRVFRFTGSEINTDATRCIRQVIDACHLIADEEPIFEIRTRFAGPAHPRWKGGPAEFTCDQCGEPFKKVSQHRTGDKKFCNQQCYGLWLHKHPEASKRRLQRDWSELGKLYAAGMSTKQLAKRYDCSQRAVLTAMRNLGIPIRPQGGYRPQGGFYLGDE